MVKPRQADSTLKLIDEYCSYYRNLFSEVRSFEAFTHLHAGIVSDIKRKTLPAIAEIMGLENAQGLHHFLTQSPWEAQALRRQRLELILKIVKGRKIVIIIDETGDPKKGKATDYVARQYLGRLGKIDNGIVAVVSYGLVDGLTFPLMFEIYKPKERLKLNDSYRSKPQIASQMIREIKAMGFEIDCVLADSLYGESTSTFIRCLQGLNLQFAVAIRSNHSVRLPPEQRVRANKWRNFERIFADGSREVRYIREIIYGKKRALRYWEITTDIETIPGCISFLQVSEKIARMKNVVKP
jgi:SRSO17 transposase